LDASKDQTEGEPQLDPLLDGADAAAVEAGHAGAEAGVETDRRCRSGRYRGSINCDQVPGGHCTVQAWTEDRCVGARVPMCQPQAPSLSRDHKVLLGGWL
jgi:hypothetical protein